MDIAIIGSGNVGSALAGAFVRAGHQVTVASRDAGDAARVAKDAGAAPASKVTEAVAGAEVVVLAVPADAFEQLAAEVGSGFDGKTVIDVTNRFGGGDPASVIDGGSNAEHLQALLPGAKVVKAFNTVLAARMAEPEVDGTKLDGFVAADDVPAKETVLELARSVGFRPIDAGTLTMARGLEAMAVLHIALQIENEWTWQSGWKIAGPTAA